MHVLDPGHMYRLRWLDGGSFGVLRFVKRSGEGYPGNIGNYPGTTTQEVLRALIDRTQYVDNQIPCGENLEVLDHLRQAIYFLEERAADRHGRTLVLTEDEMECIETLPTCDKCNHIGCQGECR